VDRVEVRAASLVGSGWRQARERLVALAHALAARPLDVLALLGLSSLLGYVLQAGMSERLRTTWHLANRWDFAISATMPGVWLFRAAVGWVPTRLPAPLPGAGSAASAFLMADFAFTATSALLFALYALALGWLARHPATPATRARTLLLIGGAGAVISALLLFSPSAPSHDPIAYGSYGRMLGTYHANPFFAVPADYPHDPLLAANEWPHSATAYGPLWNVLAWLLNPLVGDDPLRSNMVYRAVEYVFHLANIGILIVALRHLPAHLQSWRERGLLLYAWNPLVIGEVAGGHNDVAMLTLLLLGLSLLAGGRTYWAMGSFAGALLIKSSAWPLVLVVLLGLWLGERGQSTAQENGGEWRGWLRALRPVGVVAGITIASYLPFLWGHSLSEIGAASRSQPTEQALSKHLASSFATVADQIAGLPLLAHAVLALASPTLWTALISLALVAACFFVLPLARRAVGLPVALAWVYAVFLVFLSIFHLLRTWYVVPLVGLVALTPGGRAIRRFTVLLTASTQIENLFLSQSPPFNGWQPWTWLLVMGIPLAVLLADLRREGFEARAAARRSLALLRAAWDGPQAAGDAAYVGEGSRPANP
jgi:hypothetical protein